MDNNVKKLEEEFAELENLLLEYNKIGLEIMKVDSEEVELLSDKIGERDELIQKMDKIKIECSALIDSFEGEEPGIIRGMLTGSGANRSMIGRLSPLKNAIISLRSAQLQAAETDKTLQIQFASRMEEAKEQLMRLKNDKKKLDYYSSVNPTQNIIGGSLDSSF